MDKIQELEKKLAELERKQAEAEKREEENNRRLSEARKELSETRKELSETKKELGETKKELSETKKEFQEITDDILECVDHLNAAQNIEEIVTALGGYGKKMMKTEQCEFWCADKTSNKFFTVNNEGNRKYSKETPIIDEAVKGGSTVVKDNKVAIPIQSASGEVVGAIVAENAKVSDDIIQKFSVDGRYGSMYKLGLEKERLHQVGVTDKLTQLKNRLACHEYSQNTMVTSLNEGKPVTLIMCDIDHFKSVNDTYGHDAGDAVLKHVADLLRNNVRARDNVKDEVFRWGGEELIIAFDNMEKSEAFHIADRIRQVIENTPCDIGDGKKINVTMSMGVEQIIASQDISKFDITSIMTETLKRADENLYEAKQTGRNKVIAKLDNGELMTNLAEIPKEAKYTKIIGNTEYYKLGAKADLQYFSNLNNRHAENIARELNKQGVQFSGVVIDTKTTITVNKADAKAVYAAEDKCKALYSNRTSKSDLAEKQNKAEKAIEQQERNKDTKGER